MGGQASSTPYIIVIILLFILIYSIARRRSLRIPIDWPSCILYAVASWQWFSAFWANQVSLVWPIAINWFFLCLLYVLIRNLRLSKTVNRFLLVGSILVTLSNLIIVILSIAIESNLFNTQPIEFSQDTILHAAKKIGSSPNLSTCLMVILLPCVYYLIEKGEKYKILLFIFSGIYFGTVLIFQSKGGILIMLLMSMVFLFGRIKKDKFFLSLLAGLIAICVFFLVYHLIPDKDSFLRNFNPILSYLQVTGDDRLLLWSKTWELVKSNPILGVGAGNWKIAILEYGISDHTYFTRYSHAHNFLFQTTAEIGIIGGLFQILLFATPLYYFLKRREVLVYDSYYFLLAILAFYALSMFYGIGYDFKFLAIFTVCFAIYFNGDLDRFVSIPKVLKILLVLAFCFCCCYLCSIGIQKSKISNLSNNVDTVEEVNLIEQSIFRNGLNEFRGTKTNAGYIGEAYFKIGAYDEAINMFEEGLKVSPNDPYLLKRKGQIWLAKDKPNLALKTLLKSSKLNMGDLWTQLALFEAALKLEDKNLIRKQINLFEEVIKVRDENYQFYLDNVFNAKIKNYWEERFIQINKYLQLLEAYNLDDKLD